MRRSPTSCSGAAAIACSTITITLVILHLENKYGVDQDVWVVSGQFIPEQAPRILRSEKCFQETQEAMHVVGL